MGRRRHPVEANPGRDLVVRELLRHRTSLFGFVLSVVRDFGFAEEATQEVAAVACERWADFRPGTDFGAWAAEIARDKICRMSRAARCEILLSREAVEAVEKAFEEKPPAPWIDAVKSCFERLGGRTRSVLAMRYRDGMSGEQIARRTKHTASAVHAALSRARQVLARCVRRRLAGRGPG
jgi:RNA polymerase sigma-70 factor (ECF subfamily)